MCKLPVVMLTLSIPATGKDRMNSLYITCSDVNPVYPGHREGQHELTGEVIVVDFRLSAHVIRGIINQL